MPFSADSSTLYEYDANDRLLVERVDNDPDSAIDETIFYRYDDGDPNTVADQFDGTVQSRKVTYANDYVSEPGSGATSTTTFEYDERGRLSRTLVVDGGGSTDTTYEYSDQGIRVSRTDVTSGETTTYLIDPNNHTGYAQVLEESVNGVLHKSYTLGHDVLAQANTANEPLAPNQVLYFLHDGHGSTRGLVDATGAPLTGQIYAYDAYGNRLDTSSALTTLLYSGEQTDPTGMQYLRARYYDPASGRFNRLDPFAGVLSDPQSLHKYLYTHADPVNGIDPSGLRSLGETLGTVNVQNILQNLNNNAVINAIRHFERVFDFIETLVFFKDLVNTVSRSQDILRHLASLDDILRNGGQRGEDYEKLRQLESEHIEAIARRLILRAGVIIPRIAKEHGQLIRRVGRFATDGRTQTRPTLVIGLPSLPGRYTGAKFISSIGVADSLRVGLAIPNNLRGGSLFSIGFRLHNSATTHQIFRVDYHGQNRPTLRTGVASHGSAYLLGTLSGLGPKIQLSRFTRHSPVFHYHIPDSGYEE